MPKSFDESGCEECRKEWAFPFNKDAKKVLSKIGPTNYSRQADLYQCEACSSYWEEPNGAYPCGLTNEEVARYYEIEKS